MPTNTGAGRVGDQLFGGPNAACSRSATAPPGRCCWLVLPAGPRRNKRPATALATHHLLTCVVVEKVCHFLLGVCWLVGLHSNGGNDPGGCAPGAAHAAAAAATAARIGAVAAAAAACCIAACCHFHVSNCKQEGSRRGSEIDKQQPSRRDERGGRRLCPSPRHAPP
jgi:hypothetical protein